MNKAMNIALSVLLLLGLVVMQNAFASDQPVIRPEQAQMAAQRMIPAISDGFQRKNKAQLSQDWIAASAGEPLLVHNTQGQPCYYIVPIAQNGQVIATMGINAFKDEWQWYTEEYKQSKFPPVSAAEAQASVGGHIQKLKISGAASAPVLASMPDKRLYWVFSITDNNKTTRRLCVDYVNKARIVAADDIKGSSDPDSRQSGGGISAMTEPDMMDAGALASTGDPKGTISGVPHYYQWKTYYCGEGSLDMVFDYIGPRINQYEIGNVARANSSYGSYTDDLRRASHFSNLSTSVGTDAPGYGCTGYTGRGLGYGAFEYTSSTTWLTDLKKLIDSSYAISILTWYDLSYYSGHFRTVIGYDNALSEVIVHDPWNTAWGGAYGGPNVHFSNSTFEYLWSYYYYWGLFIQPWKIAVTAPASVDNGSTFTVSAGINYPCPYPFSTADYPASSSQATIALPSNLVLATGETVTKTIGTLNARASANVSWQVKAITAGQCNLSVSSEGRISGSVWAHSPYPAYNYTDRIGGEGSKGVVVNGSGVTMHNFESDLNGWTDGRSGSYLTFGRTSTRAYNGAYSLNIGARYGRNRRGTGTFTEQYVLANISAVNAKAWVYIPANNTYQSYNYIRLHAGSSYADANLALRGQWQQMSVSSLTAGPVKVSYQITISSSLRNGADIPFFADYVELSGSAKFPVTSERPVSQPTLTAATGFLTCAPNPTTGANNISYQLTSPANVSLRVYNSNGQLVKTLVSETMQTGYHSVYWDGKDEHGSKVAAGVYLYRMDTGNYSSVKKLTVIR